MIRQITSLLKDKFEIIQAESIFYSFRLSIILSTIVYIMAVYGSTYSFDFKVTVGLVLISFSALSYLATHIIKKRVRETGRQMNWLFAVIIVYTLFSSLTSPSKFMTTNGIGVVFFSVLIFLMLSRKHLIIQGIITGVLLTIFTSLGVGKTVTLGLGYVFAAVGMYALVVVVLMVGVNMFNKFKVIYQEQLVELNSKNEELNALNEEYYATEEVLRFNLDHDYMTGLLNWDGFVKCIDEELGKNQNCDFYVAYFDIDDFMYINNALGYSFGDEVLKEVVSSLQRKAHIFEHLARGEGDAMLFTFSKQHNLSHVMHQLNEVLNSLVIRKSEVKIKASVGIAEANEESKTQDLVRDAEVTMYRMKRNKKGSYGIHEPKDIKLMNSQFNIFSRLDKAIDSKEFYLLYQPKVSIPDNRVIGFEALVRWKSEELGIVYPDQFITVAEHTGQIIRLGAYIMDQAMGFAKRCAEKDDELIVSINISSSQLMDEKFIETTRYLLEKNGVSTKNIAFEVTETVYIENIQVVHDIITTICDMGIVIYLDDFGTGYSSLNYLNQLPIHILKVDKSFIDHIHMDDQSSHLAETIFSMAKSLNLKCVAEGVEEVAQYDKLIELECDYIQGYFFDKPLTEEEAYQKIEHVYKIK